MECSSRWDLISRTQLIKGPWTIEEDRKLLEWVKNNGPKKWPGCSDFITGRSGKQCRERWYNTLNPNVKKGGWTAEEDFLIFKFFSEFGSRWSLIASKFSGRTENSIKNRFYSTLRRFSLNDKKAIISNRNGSNEPDANNIQNINNNYNNSTEELMKFFDKAFTEKRRIYFQNSSSDNQESSLAITNKGSVANNLIKNNKKLKKNEGKKTLKKQDLKLPNKDNKKPLELQKLDINNKKKHDNNTNSHTNNSNNKLKEINIPGNILENKNEESKLLSKKRLKDNSPNLNKSENIKLRNNQNQNKKCPVITTLLEETSFPNKPINNSIDFNDFNDCHFNFPLNNRLSMLTSEEDISNKKYLDDKILKNDKIDSDKHIKAEDLYLSISMPDIPIDEGDIHNHLTEYALSFEKTGQYTIENMNNLYDQLNNLENILLTTKQEIFKLNEVTTSDATNQTKPLLNLDLNPSDTKQANVELCSKKRSNARKNKAT